MKFTNACVYNYLNYRCIKATIVADKSELWIVYKLYFLLYDFSTIRPYLRPPYDFTDTYTPSSQQPIVGTWTTPKILLHYTIYRPLQDTAHYIMKTSRSLSNNIRQLAWCRYYWPIYIVLNPYAHDLLKFKIIIIIILPSPL